MAEKARSVNGVALRVSRLNEDGSILAGDKSVYTQKSFMSFSWTPEYEEGEEITEKNADGSICYSSQERSTLKRVSLSLSVCAPDPELEQLLVGGTLLSDDSGGEGYAAPKAGDIANENGIAIEVWSRAMDANGKPMPDRPFFHWVFPFGAFTRTGEGVMENGLMANEYEGWSTGNEQFDPDDWPFEETGSPYQYGRVTTSPVSGEGFVPGFRNGGGGVEGQSSTYDVGGESTVFGGGDFD